MVSRAHENRELARATRRRRGEYVPFSERVYGALKGGAAGAFILALLVGIDLESGVRTDVPPAEVFGLFAAFGAALGAVRLARKKNDIV